MVGALSARPALEPHALLVLHDGETVLEQYWAPYSAGDRPLVYSASKTFSATAVGLAIGEGRFALDDRVVELLAEPERVIAADDPWSDITVHHLLSMSTGHTVDTLEALSDVPPEQWVPTLLSVPPERPAGSWHVYNNGASFLLGELVRRHTGEDLLDYLRPRVLEPLGIDATWDRDPLGRCLGYSGLHVAVHGLASLAELLRCDGVWHGRRLLPEGWAARATAKQVDTHEDPSDWNFGYGYQVWLSREGFRLDGAYGQFAFVLPERGLVVALQSAQSGNQPLIDLIWDHLDALGETVPEEPAAPRLVEPGSPEEPARNELASRRVETSATVPEESARNERTSRRAETSATVPEESARNERTSRRAAATNIPVPLDSATGTTWTSHGEVPLDPTMVPDGEEAGPVADLSDVSATRTNGEFRLTFTAEGHPVELTTIPGEWRRQLLHLGDVDVPVALAAGADASGALHARLVFTETPHTLRLRLADGVAAQAWKVNPLQGPTLALMRAH